MSGGLNAWLLYHGLVKRDIYQCGKATLWLIAKASLAASLMAGALWWVSPAISQWQQMAFSAKAQQLTLMVMIAVPAYFGLLWLFGIRLNQLKRQTIAETKS